MARSSQTSRVTFVVLRHMRRPIILLVSVYAISMLGWVLIPGADVDGKSQPLSLFHAFYFLTYTATTTGFGEIPYSFSDGQRMWSIVSLYAGVIAWLYAVGSIIRLIQNPHFRRALDERSFARSVQRLTEPFVVICGFGNTGSLLARGLSDAGIAAVVIDSDNDRINALYLRDYAVPMPGLCADARDAETLIRAGLTHPNCKAVVALTSSEDINLKISVSTCLLAPSVRMIGKCTSEDHEQILATLRGDVHIINPFQTYARYLGATIQDPRIHLISQWIAGAPHATLSRSVEPPKGTWILCGFGRMGRRLYQTLTALGIRVVVIDPRGAEQGQAPPDLVIARASQKALREAGISEAAGIVAATDNDAGNLGIVLNARALKPDVFLIVRQNRHRNEVVFRAAHADFVMQPSLVSARRMLFILTAPLLKNFFEYLREDPSKVHGDPVAEVIECLRETVKDAHPRVWTVHVAAAATPALLTLYGEGAEVTLGDLVRDPRDRDTRLDCVPLVIESGTAVMVMPDPSRAVKAGDQILFCGSVSALRLQDASFHNAYTLRYLKTGVDEIRGTVLRWLAQKRARQPALQRPS